MGPGEVRIDKFLDFKLKAHLEYLFESHAFGSLNISNYRILTSVTCEIDLLCTVLLYGVVVHSVECNKTLPSNP